MKITIGRKLFILSGISAVLVLAVGVAGYWGVSKMSARTDIMMNSEAKLLEYADDAQIYTLELRRAEKDIFLNVEEPKKMNDYMGKFKEQEGNLSKALEKLKTVATSAENQKRVKEMSEDLATYEAGIAAFWDALKREQSKRPEKEIRPLPSTRKQFTGWKRMLGSWPMWP